MDFTNHTFKKEGAYIAEYSVGGAIQGLWKILDRKPRDGKFRVVSSEVYRNMQRAHSDAVYNDYYHNRSQYIPENIIQYA